MIMPSGSRQRNSNSQLISNSVFTLIYYLRFYFPLKHFSLIWRRHHYRWRAAKFRPMLSAQGLWAGRDLYRATPAVTRGLGFSGLIRRTAPISRLVRQTWGCGGSILTRIFTGPISLQIEFLSLSDNLFRMSSSWHRVSHMIAEKLLKRLSATNKCIPVQKKQPIRLDI
jgi:hypothetical protein